jgi:hypothetical protein
MVEYSNAEQVLRPGEVGLFIFTEGLHLTLRPDGTGTTGYWRIDPRRRVEWVVIYKRPLGSDVGGELLLARPGDFEGPTSEDRYLINLRQVVATGVTRANWRDFAAAGANPIRYIERPLPHLE